MPAEYTNFSAWKNRGYGIWLRSANEVEISGARLADNRGGTYLASGGWQDFYSYMTLVDSLLIGETDNIGTPDPAYCDEVDNGRSLPLPEWGYDDPSDPNDTGWPGTQVAGVEIYDGDILVKDTVFMDYEDRVVGVDCDCAGSCARTVTRRGAALSQTKRDNPWAISPHNAVEGLTFVDANPVWFRATNPQGPTGPMSTVIVSEDTSVASVAGHRLVPESPLLAPTGSTVAADGTVEVSSVEAIGQLVLLDLDEVTTDVEVTALHNGGSRHFGSPPTATTRYAHQPAHR